MFKCKTDGFTVKIKLPLIIPNVWSGYQIGLIIIREDYEIIKKFITLTHYYLCISITVQLCSK